MILVLYKVYKLPMVYILVVIGVESFDLMTLCDENNNEVKPIEFATMNQWPW